MAAIATPIVDQLVAHRHGGGPPIDARRYRGHVVDDALVAGLPCDVTVVVVTHDSAADIDGCLASLAALPDQVRFEVVVVDNASADGTADLVARHHPWVRLIRKRGRHGFSFNCNLGASVAGGRHILLLNPDTVVSAGALQALVTTADRGGDVGALAPRLLNPDGTRQLSIRRFPSVLATLLRRTPLRAVVGDTRAVRRQLRADDEPSVHDEVDWALGAALLVPAAVYARLDGFDEGYRLYCEDIDLCWRIHELGLSVRYVPSATVEHALAEVTAKRFLTRHTLWHVRSMLRFVRRHGLGGVPGSPGDGLAPVLTLPQHARAVS
jgi:N-acetylglucosaminyl-diphospho-decaprenol L-rhamnosyltransferase